MHNSGIGSWRDVEHSIEVTAETLYEAIATALRRLQQDNWVGEIGQGFATVTVVVQQPPVKHEVKMKDFLSWLGRDVSVMLKQKLEKILGKVNHARAWQKRPTEQISRNRSPRPH